MFCLEKGSCVWINMFYPLFSAATSFREQQLSNMSAGRPSSTGLLFSATTSFRQQQLSNMSAGQPSSTGVCYIPALIQFLKLQDICSQGCRLGQLELSLCSNGVELVGPAPIIKSAFPGLLYA